MTKNSLPQLRDGIELIYRHHVRTREICDLLDRLASDLFHPDAVRDATRIERFLTHDLRWHVADEEEDLFPLLQRRCPPEDAIDDIVAMLRREHRQPEKLVDRFVSDLGRLASAKPLNLPLEFIWKAMSFAEFERRHSAWEDATILRLARLRLSDDDRSWLAARIEARRPGHQAV